MGKRVPEGQTQYINPASPAPSGSLAPPGHCTALLSSRRQQPAPAGSRPSPEPPADERPESRSRCRSHLSVQLPQRSHHELLELGGVGPGPAVGQLPAGRRAQRLGRVCRRLGGRASGGPGVSLTGARADSDVRPRAAARAARTRPPPFPAPPGRARRPPAPSTAAALGQCRHSNRDGHRPGPSALNRPRPTEPLAIAFQSAARKLFASLRQTRKAAPQTCCWTRTRRNAPSLLLQANVLVSE